MSYRINRTDGELLVDLTDGTIDSNATDLILIGRNYKGFGEWVNENFVKLLENFASTSQPSNPLTGQLWYDKSVGRLKIFNGIAFRSATGTVVNSSRPDDLIEGDIWIDNKNNRLYLFDGSDLTLVGPNYEVGQGKTGFESRTQLDINNVSRTVLLLYLGGVLVGVYSPAAMTIPVAYSINGLEADPNDSQNPKRQKLKKGFNLAKQSTETGIEGFWYHGTAANAKYLIDDQGNKKTSLNFLPTDANGETTGSLKIKNSAGITIGKGDKPFVDFKIVGTTTSIETLEIDGDFGIKVKNSQFPNNSIDVLQVDSSLYKINIWPGLPYNILSTYPSADLYGNLNVKGSVEVDGSLNVLGEVTYITSQDLKIEDRLIELASSETVSYDNDAVNGGGILLKSSDGDKKITWNLATKAWTINQNLNLISSGYVNDVDDPSIKINGTTILSTTRLYDSVVESNLETVGQLQELLVDNIYINSATISSNVTGLTINSNGDLNVSGNNITNLATQVWPASYTNPDMRNYAATIEYVDRAVQGKEILLSLDINGLIVDGDPDNTPFYEGSIDNVRQVLNYMLPIEDALIGTRVRVLGTRFKLITANFGITISADEDNYEAVLFKSIVPVRNVDNSSTVSVVEDIVPNPFAQGAATNVEIEVERFIYKFESNGLTWVSTGVNRITVN